MNPVNWAGSVSEISPHHSFLCKLVSPVTDILVFVTEISGTGLEIFPVKPGYRDET